MRHLLPLVLLASIGCGDDEGPVIICPQICDDRIAVDMSINGGELTDYDMQVSFDGVELSFSCKNGSVKQLSDDSYDVECEDSGFAIENVTPSSIDLNLNNVYCTSLQANYVSEHPTEGCEAECLAAQVSWDLNPKDSCDL